MDNQEKRAFLGEYKDIDNNVRALQNEYEKWLTIGTKITPSLSFAPGGNDNTSKVERAGVEMARLQVEIAKELDETTKKRDSIKDVIEQSNLKQRQKQILTWKYINGMSNSKIAKLINKDVRTVSAAIKKALTQLDI